MKNLVDLLFNTKPSARIRIADYIRKNFVNRNTRSRSSALHFNRMADMFERFEQEAGRNIYLDSLDEETSKAWIEFLRHTPSDKTHSLVCQSTLRLYHQKTKTVLNHAFRKGLNINTEWMRTIRVPPVKTFAVFLTEAEIERIADLRLSPSLGRVRDKFILGCCTALRYSDLIRLTPEHFTYDTIRILTQKTKEAVEIPIHYLVRRIMQRDPSLSFLSYKCSLSYFNKEIKRICKLAGINQKILVERVRGGACTRKVCPKWQLVSAHTARRSAATNMYLHNIPIYRIMLITGHKSVESFLAYIQITKTENADYLSTNSFFTGLPETVHGASVPVTSAVIRNLPVPVSLTAEEHNYGYA